MGKAGPGSAVSAACGGYRGGWLRGPGQPQERERSPGNENRDRGAGGRDRSVPAVGPVNTAPHLPPELDHAAEVWPAAEDLASQAGNTKADDLLDQVRAEFGLLRRMWL